MDIRSLKGWRRSGLTASRLGALALVAVVVAITAGCSSSTAHSGTSAATTRTSAPASSAASSPVLNYVAQVDALCGELQGKVIAVYGGQGHHTTYPIKVYLAEHAKLAAVYRAFDTQVDAIPLTATDRAAAHAFDAYRRQSDAADRALAAAAATDKQANFDAAFAKLAASEGKPDPVMDAMHGAGIFCPAR